MGVKGNIMATKTFIHVVKVFEIKDTDTSFFNLN